MDMLFAIFRRVLKREPIGAPDRLHFHQLIMRGLGLSYFNRTQQNVTNPLAATLVLTMTAVPITVSQFLWNVISQSAVALLFFGALFIVTHRSSFIVTLQGASTRYQRTAAKTNALVSDPRVTPAENVFFGNQLAFHWVGIYLRTRGSIPTFMNDAVFAQSVA